MRRYTERDGRPNRHGTVDHLGHREWQTEPYRQDTETLGSRPKLHGRGPVGPKRFGIRVTYKTWRGTRKHLWEKWYATERQRDNALRGINAKNDILETRAEQIDDIAEQRRKA